MQNWHQCARKRLNNVSKDNKSDVLFDIHVEATDTSSSRDDFQRQEELQRQRVPATCSRENAKREIKEG